MNNLQRVRQSMLGSATKRFFAAASADGYTTIDHDKWYTPVNQPSFSGKGLTVFNADDCKERRFVPWEIKEATFKNGMGLVCVCMLDILIPLGPTYSVAQMFFCLNYSWTAFSLMSNAVTKVDLLDDGKRVNLTFGRFTGKEVTVAIKDISKVHHERTLVETFEESTMYPIKVGQQTYFLNGPGQEAIKNGELFRAIVNGQSIKL